MDSKFKNKYSWVGAFLLFMFFIACENTTPEVVDAGIETSNICSETVENQCETFPHNRCGTCADTLVYGLCSYIPRDVDFEVNGLGYDRFNPTCQKPFDWFSWQTFIALNWPAYSADSLAADFNGNVDLARRWEYYFNPEDIFDMDLSEHLPVKHGDGTEVHYQFSKTAPNLSFGSDNLEAFSNQPIIDKNLNYVIYNIKVNKEERDYIVDTAQINTYCGQKKFVAAGNKRASFPVGNYPEDQIGAMEIKAAWKILTHQEVLAKQYYTRVANIKIPADYSTTGSSFTEEIHIGLIGMHIIRKVMSEGESFIWSSFEHVGLAPTCTDPANCPDGDYAFYNADCTDCPLNNPPKLKEKEKKYKWTPRSNPSDDPAFAKSYAIQGAYGTQIARLHPVETSTEEINTHWQNLEGIKNTVWANYKLIGSQWFSEEGFDAGNIQKPSIPVFQSNMALETYTQDTSQVAILFNGHNVNVGGSCVSCHSAASLAVDSFPTPMSADFSFLLNNVTKMECD